MPLMRFSELSDPITTHRFSNGLLLVVHHFKAPAVGLTYLVRCGPIVETPESNGVSHFLEHMLFRGVPSHPSSTKLGLALEDVGVEANAATFPDMTILSQKVLPERVEDAMLIFKSMITEPIFDRLSAERKIILEECLEDQDEEGQLIAIDQLSSQLMYQTHPYALPILGTPQVIEGVSRSQLKAHLKRHYRPSSSVLCISGPLTYNKVLKLTKTIFGDWADPLGCTPEKLEAPGHFSPSTNGKISPVSLAQVPPFNGPRILWVRTPRSQIQCRLSLNALSFTHPDYFKEKALLRILDSGPSSPLRKVLQEEKGLCYSLGAGLDSYEQAGAMHIDLILQEESLIDGLSECFQIFSKIKKSGVSDEMVERMISQYIKAKRFSSTDLWDFSGRYGFGALFSVPFSFDQEFEATQELRPKEINLISAKIFQKENIGVTLVGPISGSLIQRIRGIFNRLDL